MNMERTYMLGGEFDNSNEANRDFYLFNLNTWNVAIFPFSGMPCFPR